MSLKLPSIHDHQQDFSDRRQSGIYPAIFNLDRKIGSTSLENSPIRQRPNNQLFTNFYEQGSYPNSQTAAPGSYQNLQKRSSINLMSQGNLASPDTSPMRRASNVKSMAFPAGMHQNMPNYNRSPPPMQNNKFLPFPNATPGIDNNNFLVNLIEKQNNLIEKMSQQVNNHNRQMMHQETKLLKEKLQRLEYEKFADRKISKNALSNQYNIEHIQQLNQIDAERYKPPREKSQKKKNKGIVDLLNEYKVLDKLVTDKKFAMLQQKEALLRKINKKPKNILPPEIHEPEPLDQEPEYQPPVRPNRYHQHQTPQPQQYSQQPQRLSPQYEPQIYRSPSIKPKTPPPQQQKTQETFEEENTVSDHSLTLHHFDFADVDESVQSPAKPILGGMDSSRHPHEDEVYERVGKAKTKYRKPAGKPKLRAILWTMVIPGLLADNVKDLIVEHRTDIQEVMTENIHKTFQVAEEFLIKIGDKYLKSLILCRNNLEMDGPKELPAKDIDSRVHLIVTNFKFLFENMIVGTTKQNLAPDFIRFLAFISEDSGMLPHDFMFEFEINRLQFTSYATLKNMDPLSSKMILGCFILLRVLLHKIIMRPWTALPSLKENNINKKNLLTIGSILYHAIVDYFRENISICPNNQKLLPEKFKVKAQRVKLTATDEKTEDPKAPKTTDVITGFLTKKQLKVFFVDRKSTYDNLKKGIADWLDKMYNLTHNLYLNTPKEERILLGLPTDLLQEK